MSNVVVTINERTYDLTCNDGQEQHLRDLASDIGRRVNELTKTVGQPGEARLLLMVGLLLADELADANAEIDRLQGEQSRAPAVDERAVAATLERLAKHVQDIAARVEAA